LVELNAEFRAAYARARAEVLAHNGPVIVFDGEKLVLLDQGRRSEGTPVAAEYHRLKTMAHLPFAVYLELRDRTDAPLDEGTRERLRQLRERISAVERVFGRYEFAPSDRDRQQRLLEQSARFLDDASKGGIVTQAVLIEFCRRSAPDLEANIDAAAALELDHYRRQVEAWREQLSPAAWNSLRVVVEGSQMPRRRHRVVQLFAALLGEKGEGKRIVYAESIYEEQRALNLLGTHLLDAESAAAFFDDPGRLDRDLLAAGAAKYLREHPVSTR
jgi:hypothetical protein